MNQRNCSIIYKLEAQLRVLENLRLFLYLNSLVKVTQSSHEVKAHVCLTDNKKNEKENDSMRLVRRTQMKIKVSIAISKYNTLCKEAEADFHFFLFD